jgi:hypothetical protein
MDAIRCEKESKRKYEEYEIKGWVRTLQEAEEIKNNKEKMKLLKPFLKKEVDALDELKTLLNNKDFGEE